MPLPKCVKTDPVSRETMEGEGWRYVGTQVTYEGVISRIPNNRVVPCSPKDAVEIARNVEWSGRLWRDPLIDGGNAWKETERFIKSDDHSLYRIGQAAFGMFGKDVIHLIGVHPVARGLGLAKCLIWNFFDGPVRAGTYSDNEAAIKLYESLGMRATYEQAVFHK